jgi:adhesin transport system membrane fusion protein
MAAAVEPNYWVDPADADRKGFWIFGHLLLITIAGMLIAFLVWADNAVLDIVTRGQGKVIPSSTVQMLQNLDGGIMADILVHEGDLVDKDQILLRIDNTTAQSNYDDLHSRYLSGSAAITRLTAEIAGTSADDIVFPEELMRDAPELADDERKNARIRHDQLKAQVDVLHDQATQKEQEVDQLTNKIDNLKQSLALAQKTLNIMNSMEEGVVSQIDKLKAQRDVHDLKSELRSRSCSCGRQSRPNRRPRTGSGSRN